MSERIRELAQQAGIFKPKEFHQHIDALQLEKFAELIIQECALQCVHNEDMDLIEKHFGVKE